MLNELPAETEYTEYDASKLDNERIGPLVFEIKKICKLNNVPFVCSCAISNKMTDKGIGKTKYVHDGVFTGSSEIHLYEDRLEDFLLVLRGAKLRSICDVDLDEESVDYLNSPPEDDYDEDEIAYSEDSEENAFEDDLTDVPPAPENIKSDPSDDAKDDDTGNQSKADNVNDDIQDDRQPLIDLGDL